MADYRSEDLVAEAETEQAENEVVIASTPASDAGFDETAMAAHFDAAVTEGQQRVSGVYNEGPVPEAPVDTDPSRDGGNAVWGSGS